MSSPRRESMPSPTYRADIDGLRALAVLLVLVFHFRLLPLGKAGFIGVDVFFVISGYLITGILLRQLERDSLSLGAFYLHRIRRLAPALLVILALTALAGCWLLLPEDLVQLLRQVLASQWYVANIYFWRTVNYFGLNADQSMLLHMWSLAVEEQFYFFYPLVLWLLHRWLGLRWLGWALLGLAILSFALNILLVQLKPEATFYLLPTRAWELLAGALLHWVKPRLAGYPALPGPLGWTGLALIFIPLFLHQQHTPVPGSFVLWPVLGGAGLILAGSYVGRPGTISVSRCFSWTPIVYIGRISYPAYLVHWPVHVLAGLMLGDRYTLAWRWLMFLGSLTLASAIFHGIEEPVRRGRWFADRLRLLGGYALGLLLGAGLWIASEVTNGLPTRFLPETARLSAQVNDRPALMPTCEQVPRHDLGSGTCLVGIGGSAPSWIVIGDSHAWALHPALDLWLKQRGESAVFAFQHGCPPLFGLYLLGSRGERCFEFNQGITRLAQNQPGFHSVLLISTWLQAAEGRLGLRPDASPADSITAFSRQFDATVRWWHAQGRQVHVWEPLPGARRSVPQAMARAHEAGLAIPDPALAYSRQDYETRYRFFFEAMAGVRPLLAASISPAAMLCGSDVLASCRFEHQGSPLYYDNNHPSLSSAPIWADLLARSVPNPAR